MRRSLIADAAAALIVGRCCFLNGKLMKTCNEGHARKCIEGLEIKGTLTTQPLLRATLEFRSL